MKKFEGWRTEELQYVATLMAGRDMINHDCSWRGDLYNEIIREIRNRRVKEELSQMKMCDFSDLPGEEE
jgi:predicted phage-related endonuclease